MTPRRSPDGGRRLTTSHIWISELRLKWQEIELIGIGPQLAQVFFSAIDQTMIFGTGIYTQTETAGHGEFDELQYGDDPAQK
jgi:hypothetical protein